MTRRDYYDFTHSLLPKTLFKSPEIIIGQVLENKEAFTEKLKLIWKSIKFRKNQPRSSAPNFSINVEKIDENNSVAIIHVPEASEAMEAPYIGIVFDKEFSTRYFTYEIGDYMDKDHCVVCEWSLNREHVSWQIHNECSLENFIREIMTIIKL